MPIFWYIFLATYLCIDFNFNYLKFVNQIKIFQLNIKRNGTANYKKSGKIIIHFLSSNTILTCFLSSHTLNSSLPLVKSILYNHYLQSLALKSQNKSTSPSSKIKLKLFPSPTYSQPSIIMPLFSIKLVLITSRLLLLL